MPSSDVVAAVGTFGRGSAYGAGGHALEVWFFEGETDGCCGGRDCPSQVGLVLIDVCKDGQSGRLENVLGGETQFSELQSAGEDAVQAALWPGERGYMDSLKARSDLTVGGKVEIAGVHRHDEPAVDLARQHSDVAGKERIGELRGMLVVWSSDPRVGVVEHEHGIAVARAKKLNESLQCLDYLTSAYLLLELVSCAGYLPCKLAADHASAHTETSRALSLGSAVPSDVSCTHAEIRRLV
jgi:hypothetical protein